MSEQAPEHVDRYQGEPPQPDPDEVPDAVADPERDQDLGEDVASAAVGAPGEDMRHAGTGERPEDRPQDS